jgi:hypothetical protein
MPAVEFFTAHNRFDAVCGIVGTIVWPAALYGIHKRKLATWKLGFAWIVFGSCAFLIRALSVTAGLPRNLDHRIVFPFIVISALIVTIYWGRWWYRQNGASAKRHGRLAVPFRSIG